MIISTEFMNDNKILVVIEQVRTWISSQAIS
ncbi:MAG: hypothetical protein H6Q74_1868 [Firmicutes bacterium]|nr:hypothetical protein [Bacillota bacterium]